jgi:hypothetical protein
MSLAYQAILLGFTVVLGTSALYMVFSAYGPSHSGE